MGIADQFEAIGAVEAGHIQGRGKSRGLPEDDVRRSGKPTIIGGREGRADDQVLVPVRVDVSRRRHREPEMCGRPLAEYAEPVRPVQSRQVEVRSKSGGFSEYDVGDARIGRRSDDEIIKSVAIDIEGSDRVAGEFIGVDPTELEPVGSVQARRIQGRCEARPPPEHDVLGA